ncbi:MAG: hypothetical protein ACQEUG_15955 [Pseudomonadota bacterium]
MQKALTAIIDWYGPYSVEEAKEAAKQDYDDGLYMIIGRRKWQRGTHLQYIGLASNLYRRLHTTRYVQDQEEITEHELWLGEVASPRTPGSKIKVTDKMLDLAEWTHAYFLQLPLNDKKRKSPPDTPIVTYNRWWRTDYETLYVKRPHADWPDMIDFIGYGYEAKVVWFGGRQVRAPVEDFVE